MAYTIEYVNGYWLFTTNNDGVPVDELESTADTMIQKNFKLFAERFGDATAQELING